MLFQGESRSRLLFSLLALLGLVAASLALPKQAAARYASIVIEADSGRVLHQVNATTRNYPASLTKMMTLYLAFEALQAGRLKPGQRLKVSARAARMPASKLGLRRGQTIRVEDAILALVTKSANDAAVVIAEALAGSEAKFARRMTKKARALGMKRTSFRNASGLPNRRQLSTAKDMALLAQALIRDFPKHYGKFSTRTFRYRGRTYRNHNSLLKSFVGTDGIKTGYTRASGYNVAVSTVRDGERLIAVVFGGKSARARDRHVAKLLDKGFTRIVAEKNAPIPLRPPQPTVTTLVAKATPTPAPPPSKPAAVVATPIPTPPPPKPAALLASRAPAAGAPEQGSASPSTTASDLPPSSRRPEALMAWITAGPVQAVRPPPAKPQFLGASQQLAKIGRWGVQVGAFYRYNPAKRAAAKAAQRFPELFADARVVIPHIEGRRGRIYRARLFGLTKDEARKACRHLKSVRVDCLVVQAKDKVELALKQTAEQQ